MRTAATSGVALTAFGLRQRTGAGDESFHRPARLVAPQPAGTTDVAVLGLITALPSLSASC